MKREEEVVFNFLKKFYGDTLIFEPEPNNTPDIEINKSIAVEVRRLNQYFFNGDEPEALEKISFSIEKTLQEVLKSMGKWYAGRTYWLDMDYKRPIHFNKHNINREMEAALKKFLCLKIIEFPYHLNVNSEIDFTIYESLPKDGRTFIYMGCIDEDAGGAVIPMYVHNLKLCIEEKSKKIARKFELYEEWWLYLVDYLGEGLKGLDSKEISMLKEWVGDTGNFNKIVILSCDGNTKLMEIVKLT